MRKEKKNEVCGTQREELIKGGSKRHLNGTLAVSMRRRKRCDNKTVRMKNVKKILKNANNEKKLTCEKLSTRTSNTEVGENKKK